MAKIVQMTSVHVPFDTRIFHKECRSLAEAGYDVVLIARHDRSETVEGVRVEGLRPRRGRISRMVLRPLEVYRRAQQEDADLYHFHDPELLPIGWMLARTGKPVVWDTHEDHPSQILTKDWLPARLRPAVSRVVAALEQRCHKRFAAVISAEPLAARRFHRDVTVLQNWPILESTPGGSPYGDRDPVVAYVGTVNRQRGLLEMVEAINLVPGALGARLDLAGPVQLDELKAEAQGRDTHERVRWLGYQNRDQVHDLLARARVGLCVLHPTDQYRAAQPVKLMEYMAAGIPFVASDFPFWQELTGGEKAGLFVDPQDPSAVAEAMTWILEHPAEAAEMGARGRRQVERALSWQSERLKLLQLYEWLLSTPGDGAADGVSTTSSGPERTLTCS